MRDSEGHNGAAWDSIGWCSLGFYIVRHNGTVLDKMGQDGTGWDSLRQDGIVWEGME